MKSKVQHILFFMLSAICSGCLEELNLNSETEFESVLVVEARITNELKRQEIKLSRSYPLAYSNENAAEQNAQVSINMNDGTNYIFEEELPGVYRSVSEFIALPDMDYILNVVTQDDNIYVSESTKLTNQTVIDDLYIAVDLNENGEEGISVYVDAFDPNGNSKFYRFEFEEAYEIKAPLWVSEDLDFGTPPDEPQFILVPRPIEEQVCYNVKKSNEILITNTLDFEQDRLEQYRIRFLNKNNYIISHRYTIEVKQYIQSREAYSYYETIKNFSTSEDIFSENQVGFFQGNITSIANEGEKVVGFFEVTSVDAKRIYFNYEDVYPGELLPPYVKDCNFTVKPATFNPFPVGPLCPLCSFISDGNWKYLMDNPAFDPNDANEGPYLLVVRECGDCTPLGSSTPPEYWIN